MYIKIHSSKDYPNGNSQSCADLTEYLEKENLTKNILTKELFFDQNNTSVDKDYVIFKIDNNVKSLKSKEDKFYMLSVNPSQKELKHLANLATSGKDINNISEFSAKELKAYDNLLKDYTRTVMDEYAKGFNKGLTGDNLVYFAKLEQERKYKGVDEEVKAGKAISGQIKPGLQSHVHIIVSRMDKVQKMRLSPNAKSKGSKNHKLNNKSVTQGIDIKAFVKTCEQSCDQKFKFHRKYENSYKFYDENKKPLLNRYNSQVQEMKQNLNLVKKASHVGDNPEQDLKSAAMIGLNKLTANKFPTTQINNAASMLQNPATAKNILLSHLNNSLEQLAPPEVRIAKKIAETVSDVIKKPISKTFKI